MIKRFAPLTFFLFLCLSISPISCYCTAESAPLIPIEESAPMEVDFNKEMLKMLGALGAIIGLLFLTIYVLKKVSMQRGFKRGLQESIHILERKALSPKSTLYLVDIEGKKTLIAESSAQITPLAIDSSKRRTNDEEEASESDESSFLSFKELFKKKPST